MSEFKVIESQEQLDAIIGERIKKNKETLEKKYAGYLSPEDFEAKKTDYETRLGDMDKAIKEANEKIAGHDKLMAEKDARIKQYESHSVKSRIAHEMGLSYEAIDFIKGEDEDSIKKSAESLKTLVGNTTTAPLASTETALGSATDAALKNTLRGLKGE